MVKDYEQPLTESGVTQMGQEGYGTSMHATRGLTDGDKLILRSRASIPSRASDDTNSISPFNDIKRNYN